MRPILFELGPFSISSLWFFVAAGFFAAGYGFIKLAIKRRMNIHFLLQRTVFMLITGLIAGRIVFILKNLPLYFEPFSLLRLFAVFDQGISFFGFMFGFIAAIASSAWKEKESVAEWMDITVFSALIGLFFGHIGRFLDGTNYGHDTALPWGMLFETPIVQYSVPVHPTQLYAALYTLLIISSLIVCMRRKFLARAGDSALYGTAVYGAFLFLEQFFRGDDVLVIFGLREGFYVSGILIIVPVIMYFRRWQKNKAQPSS